MNRGEKSSPIRVYGKKMQEALPSDPLARVCALLNKAGARYLVVGAQACILHGLVRTTEDVDILIEETEENFHRVIQGLSGLADHAAAELTPADLRENAVVKIADEIEVDVSRRAWNVAYSDASATALTTEIEGIPIPYAALHTLIESKKTYRDRDRADLLQLLHLEQQVRGGRQPPQT